MSGLPVAIPNIPRSHDLMDPTDPVDRSLETALGRLQVVQGYLYGLTKPGAGFYLAPDNIVPATQAAYETNVDDAITAVSTAIAEIIAIRAQ